MIDVDSATTLIGINIMLMGWSLSQHYQHGKCLTGIITKLDPYPPEQVEANKAAIADAQRDIAKVEGRVSRVEDRCMFLHATEKPAKP